MRQLARDYNVPTYASAGGNATVLTFFKPDEVGSLVHRRHHGVCTRTLLTAVARAHLRIQPRCSQGFAGCAGCQCDSLPSLSQPPSGRVVIFLTIADTYHRPLHIITTTTTTNHHPRPAGDRYTGLCMITGRGAPSRSALHGAAALCPAVLVCTRHAGWTRGPQAPEPTP